MASFGEYDFIVINDELTAAVDRLRGIVLAERARSTACARTRGIVETFRLRARVARSLRWQPTDRKDMHCMAD